MVADNYGANFAIVSSIEWYGVGMLQTQHTKNNEIAMQF